MTMRLQDPIQGEPALRVRAVLPVNSIRNDSRKDGTNCNFRDGEIVWRRRAVRVQRTEVCGLSFDEELLVDESNMRVIWKVACNKYLQVTTPRKVLQVGWITFRDSTDTSFMCILMPGLLQLQDDDGEEYSIPLLQDFIRFSPIPDGLLLTDTEGGHFILYSPMDEIINLQASLHQTDVLQETIVWSSGDSPLVASYDHRKHQLSIWRVQPPREGREETIERKAASAFHAVSHVQTSETPRGASRTPLRLPDGSLSPHAFQASATRQDGSLVKSKSFCHMQLVYRDEWKHGASIEACLMGNGDGDTIVVCCSLETGHLKALRFGTDCKYLGLAFETEGIKSIAAVEISTTRYDFVDKGEQIQQHPVTEKLSISSKPRDLLLLRHNGSLVLYSGAMELNDVKVALPRDEKPYVDILGSNESDSSALKEYLTTEPNSGSMSPPNWHSWNECVYVKHGAIVKLLHAAGDRVSLLFDNGFELRVCLATIHPLSTIIRANLPYLLDMGLSSGSISAAWSAGLISFFGDHRSSEFNALRAIMSRNAHPREDMEINNYSDKCAWDILKRQTYELSCTSKSFHWLQSSEPEDLPSLQSSTLTEVSKCASLNLLNIPALEDINRRFGFNEEPDVTSELKLALYGHKLSCQFISNRLEILAHNFWIISAYLKQIAMRQNNGVDKSLIVDIGRSIVEQLDESAWNLSMIDSLPWHFAVLLKYFYLTTPKSLKSKLPPYLQAVVSNIKNTNPVGSFSHSDIDDGMQHIEKASIALRFGEDRRLIEVRRLLASSAPAIIRGREDVDESTEGIQKQEADLYMLASRTMALPFGRAAFVFKTHRCLPTESLDIPPLCLSAKVIERNNAIVNLDLSSATPPAASGAMAEFTAWPEFHNGVATGLRLAPGARLSRTWIAYNSPPEASYAHAGMLLALGLTGQLSCLAVTDLYRHLSQEHDPTVVSILLGMAAAKRSTMDPSISKMIFLHLPTNHPAGYPELELSPLVQTAAVLALGMLYQGSRHRGIIKILVQEIGRHPGNSGRYSSSRLPHQGVTKDCEGYALAAGFGLGLVMLGKGRTGFRNDDSVEEQLRYFLHGGLESGLASQSGFLSAMGAPGATIHNTLKLAQMEARIDNGSFHQSSVRDSNRGSGAVAEELLAAQAAAQLILEGDLVNLHVTSPAAAVALGLTYLKTNDERCASLFKIPSTYYELSRVHPRHLCLRCIMANMICWDSIRPSKDWVLELLPPILKHPFSNLVMEMRDSTTIIQAHFHVIVGACISLGIRYAGTEDTVATETLRNFVVYFLKTKNTVPSNILNVLGKGELENGLANIALALSMVLAGSGDLKTLALLRSLLRRVGIAKESQSAISYGSYMAISQALGFLFLGAGSFSFSSDLESVAALIISTFPYLPENSSDNRYYMQALRHFWVLATIPRKQTANTERQHYVKERFPVPDELYDLTELVDTLSHEKNSEVSSEFIELVEGLLGDSILNRMTMNESVRK